MFEKFSLVTCKDSNDGFGPYVILSNPMQIPYFQDGVASEMAFVPIDFTDPKEWNNYFEGYVCWDIRNQSYKILATYNLRALPNDPDELNLMAYIPYDQATARTRTILGLLQLSNRWSNNQQPTEHVGDDEKEFENVLRLQRKRK